MQKQFLCQCTTDSNKIQLQSFDSIIILSSELLYQFIWNAHINVRIISFETIKFTHFYSNYVFCFFFFRFRSENSVRMIFYSGIEFIAMSLRASFIVWCNREAYMEFQEFKSYELNVFAPGNFFPRLRSE